MRRFAAAIGIVLLFTSATAHAISPAGGQQIKSTVLGVQLRLPEGYLATVRENDGEITILMPGADHDQEEMRVTVLKGDVPQGVGARDMDAYLLKSFAVKFTDIVRGAMENFKVLSEKNGRTGGVKSNAQVFTGDFEGHHLKVKQVLAVRSGWMYIFAMTAYTKNYSRYEKDFDATLRSVRLLRRAR